MGWTVWYFLLNSSCIWRFWTTRLVEPWSYSIVSRPSHAFQRTRARKTVKAWSIWWCNQMQFEVRLHISAHSPTQLVTWWSHDHVHCVREWAEICNRTSNHIWLHHQIDQAFLIFSHMYVEKHGLYNTKTLLLCQIVPFLVMSYHVHICVLYSSCFILWEQGCYTFNVHAKYALLGMI